MYELLCFKHIGKWFNHRPKQWLDYGFWCLLWLFCTERANDQMALPKKSFRLPQNMALVVRNSRSSNGQIMHMRSYPLKIGRTLQILKSQSQGTYMRVQGWYSQKGLGQGLGLNLPLQHLALGSRLINMWLARVPFRAYMPLHDM